MPLLLLGGLVALLGVVFFARKSSAVESVTAPVTDLIEKSSNALGSINWRIGMMSEDKNITAFENLIGELESQGDYTAIAGGDHFSDFSEHPFIINPKRHMPLGTTASGKYQMVRRTWMMARDALGLTDFSPASQDAAARWILEHKIPGTWDFAANGTGNIDLIISGDFEGALNAYRLEWESLDKILKGTYYLKLSDAQTKFETYGGNVA